MRALRPLLPALLLALAGCNGAEPVPDGPETLSDAEAARLSRRLQSVLVQRLGGPYRDDEIRALVADIGTRLTAAAHITAAPVPFIVLNVSNPNVVAGPVGPIFVTRGAVARCSSGGALAACLAHALAHAALGHVPRKLEGAFSLDELRKAAGDGTPVTPASEGLAELGRVADAIPRLCFDAAECEEATRRAQEILQAAGFPADLAPLVPWILRCEHLGDPDALAAYEETHAAAPGQGSVGIPPSDLDARFAPMREGLEAVQLGYAQYDEAERLRAAGQYDRAVEKYEAACAIDNRQSPFHVGLGRTLLVLGDFTGADREMIRAVLLDENLFWTRYWRGAVHHAAGRHREAVEQFNLAIALDPTSALPYLRMGYSLNEQGARDRAIDAFRRCLELACDDDTREEARGQVDALTAQP